MAFGKNEVTGLSIIPSNTLLSFNLPLALNPDHCERNYFDNIWTNNRKPSFPMILTQFANYLHSKNLKTQLDNPTLRPKPLDAFLEMQQTIKIMIGQQQPELTRQKLKKKQKKINSLKDKIVNFHLLTIRSAHV